MAPALYHRGKGCDIFLYDFSTRLEEKIAGASVGQANETWPSIWRSEIAFQRNYDRKPDYPYLYVRTIGAGHRSRRQPGGQRKKCSRDGRGRLYCSDDRLSHADALDLYGRRLAFKWFYAGLGEGPDSEIRLDALGGSHEVLQHQGGGGLTQVDLDWPAFESGARLLVAELLRRPGRLSGALPAAAPPDQQRRHRRRRRTAARHVP